MLKTGGASQPSTLPQMIRDENLFILETGRASQPLTLPQMIRDKHIFTLETGRASQPLTLLLRVLKRQTRRRYTGGPRPKNKTQNYNGDRRYYAIHGMSAIR